MTSLVESTKKNSLSSSLSRLMPESISNAPSQALDTTINADTGSSVTNFFANITWQTWLIVVLILALLGINLFSYLAKATTDVSGFINKYFGPILALFGISALETTKQTINTSATGTKAGVDFVADTTTGAIDTVEDIATTTTTKTTTDTIAPSTSATARPSAQKASSSQKGSMPVQQQIQEAGSVYEWNQGSLDSALNDAAKQPEPMPNETANYTTGKAGWCFIGDDRNTRACAQVGVNDMCMSGDIFPTQDVCMNPNLRV
jgi:hypothetical protein